LKSPSVQLLLLLYLIALAFVLGMGWPWPHDPDIWWHLKTGEWIAAHHAVPWTDPFGANTQGKQWIAYSWLAELLFHGIDQAQPMLGLHLLQGCIVAAATGILTFHAYLRAGSLRAAILLGTLSLAPLIPWVARPQIFSFLFTALVMLILWWGRHRHARVLWLLPPLIAVWANIHVYFIVGIGLIAIHFLQDWKRMPEHRRFHGVLLLLCLLAPLLNPYGLHLYGEVFALARHGSEGWAAGAIRELASPSFHDWSMKIFFLWVALGGITLMLSKKRPGPVTVLLFFGLLYQALQHRRDIPYFVIVMLPIIADHLAHSPRQSWRNFFSQGAYVPWRNHARPKALLHWLVALGILPIMLVPPYRLLHVPDALKAEHRQTEMTGAANYLLQARPPGPLYHSLNWGGYFIYALTPAYPVYMDCRTQLYSRRFWKAHDQARLGLADWEKNLDESGARTVIWDKGDALASLLLLSPHWKLVWSDAHAVVFVKRAP
jgi:hypothetical protein